MFVAPGRSSNRIFNNWKNNFQQFFNNLLDIWRRHVQQLRVSRLLRLVKRDGHCGKLRDVNFLMRSASKASEQLDYCPKAFRSLNFQQFSTISIDFEASGAYSHTTKFRFRVNSLTKISNHAFCLSNSDKKACAGAQRRHSTPWVL